VSDDEEIDLGVVMGAVAEPAHQVLRLYIPDRNRHGAEIGNQRRYVLEGSELLAEIGGGVTIEPPVEGGWKNEAAGVMVWERPVVVYTFIRPDQFRAALERLRAFLHRLGRETDQGEVAFEFGDQFFRITEFTP
jgi:hypothetical protein